jgi:hypothetical protein
MMSHTASLPIVLCHSLNSGIELAVFVTNKWIINAISVAMPHLLMNLDKQNMVKTSFKLPASDSCGDVCAAECLVNGQKVLVVTVYVSPNTPSDNWKSLIFSNLAGYSPKV